MYTHIDNEPGGDNKVRHFAITTLNKSPLVLGIPPNLAPIDHSCLSFLLEKRGLEHHRLDRITKDIIFGDPIIMAEWDKTWLILDGNHRFAKAIMLDMKVIPARFLPRTIWEQFLIEGTPKEYQDTKNLAAVMQNSFSGIY